MRSPPRRYGSARARGRTRDASSPNPRSGSAPAARRGPSEPEDQRSSRERSRLLASELRSCRKGQGDSARGDRDPRDVPAADVRNKDHITLVAREDDVRGSRKDGPPGILGDNRQSLVGMPPKYGVWSVTGDV